MPGSGEASRSLFSYVDLKQRIPARHPLEMPAYRKLAAPVGTSLGYENRYDGRPHQPDDLINFFEKFGRGARPLLRGHWAFSPKKYPLS